MRLHSLVPLLCVVAVGFAGCSSDGQPIGMPVNDRTRWESEWKSYQRFKGEKALALAGDVEGQFVTGIATGRATQEEAVQAAMDDCAQRRSDRRLTDACRLWAIGNEVVAD